MTRVRRRPRPGSRSASASRRRLPGPTPTSPSAASTSPTCWPGPAGASSRSTSSGRSPIRRHPRPTGGCERGPGNARSASWPTWPSRRRGERGAGGGRARRAVRPLQRSSPHHDRPAAGRVLCRGPFDLRGPGPRDPLGRRDAVGPPAVRRLPGDGSVAREGDDLIEPAPRRGPRADGCPSRRLG